MAKEIIFHCRPGEHEGSGQSAPRKNFRANKRKCPDSAGHVENLAVTVALGIALLLSDEGFQKTLSLEVGVPNVSKGSVFAL